MELTKECPLCGDRMRMKRREEIVLVPGMFEPKATEIVEWICSDCDYFEEIEEDAGPS